MYIKAHNSQIFGICLRAKFSKPMAINFISFLSKLESTRGVKSVVDILKERYHAIVAGEMSLFKTHSDGTWVGPFRPVSRLALRGRLGRRRALRLLRCHGLFVHKAAVRGDYQKSAAKLSKNPEPDEALFLPPVPVFTSLFRGIPSNIYSDTYPLTTKRAPFLDGTKIPEVLMSPAEHISSLDAFPSFMVEFYDQLADLVGSDLPEVGHFQRLASTHPDTAGSVALLTKDRGLKLRLIANTNRMLQLAVSPLHNYLFAFLRKHSTSFVYDQDAGERWVANRLSEGARLTSLDLESASDNIPLLPQLELLRFIEPKLEIEIRMFERVARMRWLTPFKGVEIRWLRGHPMGVMGSFPLFTTWLCSVLEYSGLTEKYAIVGDDLVFFAKYERKVRSLLQFYQVPISFGKSLFDNSFIAEFVGRIIDSIGSLDVFKASDYNRDDPTGLIRQYGEGALNDFKSVSRLRVKTKDVLKLGHRFESDPLFREVCILFASPKDKVFMTDVKPPPLNLGGVSDTIIDKMVGNLLLKKILDEDGEKVVRYCLLRILDNGRLYDQLTVRSVGATVVQKLTVRSNAAAHVEHRKMLRSLLDNALTDDDIVEVLSYIKYSPGVEVVDVAKAEHVAKQNQMVREDIHSGEKHRVRRKRKFSYYFALSRAIHRTAKIFKGLKKYIPGQK
jgi:hypothetical protein